eukprot:8196608-Ditylum_brightwellii.AAC.1
MVGRQLNSFVHTIKRVVSHTDWKNNIEWEISRTKRLGNKKVWVKKVARDEGQLWENDGVMEMKGVSKKIKKKLARAGAEKVCDLKYLDESDETMKG